MKEWVSRTLENRLLKLAGERPVLVVTGARQTGKTSLVRHVFPSYSYVTLDLPSEAEQAERDPQSFLARHPPPVIVDEIQYAPGLLRHLKAIVDANRKSNGRFVITGSQKFALMKGVSESLAGRAAILELEGLSLRELESAGMKMAPEAAAVRGFMPELWEKPGMDGHSFYASYIATYLERDLRSLLDVGSLRDFERFLRACALRSGQLLNKAELARDIGISPSTAGIWLSALETTNQIFLLEPWFSNRTKSLVKAPKLYLNDTGLLCHFLGIRSVEDLMKSSFTGAVWETLVCSELRKNLRETQKGELFFWRDRTKEADFLIHSAGKFEIMDAKWAEHPDAKDAKKLNRVAEELPARSVQRQALVTRCRNAYPLEKAMVIPVKEV